MLLADELTAELDHHWKQRTIGLVLDIATRGGLVVIATHDNDIVDRCSHRIHLTDGRTSTQP